MKREMVMKYLNSECTRGKDFEAVLKQFKQQNNDFMVECLLQLKSSNLDQMEQILNDARQQRMVLTDVLQDLNDRDCFFYQICCFINTWNLFNKILEIEDEKQETNKDIKTILANELAAREVLIYLYHHPRAKDSDINETLTNRYNLDVVENTLNVLCDSDIVYKTSIGNDAIYELTENARRWVEKNIDTGTAVTWTVKVTMPMLERKKVFFASHATQPFVAAGPVMA